MDYISQYNVGLCPIQLHIQHLPRLLRYNITTVSRKINYYYVSSYESTTQYSNIVVPRAVVSHSRRGLDTSQVELQYNIFSLSSVENWTVKKTFVFLLPLSLSFQMLSIDLY